MLVGISTVSEKGQITIPKKVRERLGITPGDRVVFEIDGGRVFLSRVEVNRLSEVLDSQRPWPLRGIEYQRRLREEWP